MTAKLAIPGVTLGAVFPVASAEPGYDVFRVVADLGTIATDAFRSAIGVFHKRAGSGDVVWLRQCILQKELREDGFLAHIPPFINFQLPPWAVVKMVEDHGWTFFHRLDVLRTSVIFSMGQAVCIDVGWRTRRLTRVDIRPRGDRVLPPGTSIFIAHPPPPKRFRP